MLYRPVIVLLIIAGMAGLTSCGSFKAEHERSLLRANEQILRDNLYQLRKAVDLYTAEHGALPQSLDDLVKAGYVREIPSDPLTGGKGWKVVIGDDPNVKGGKGIADVHSAAMTKSSEGTLYSEW